MHLRPAGVRGVRAARGRPRAAAGAFARHPVGGVLPLGRRHRAGQRRSLGRRRAAERARRARDPDRAAGPAAHRHCAVGVRPSAEVRRDRRHGARRTPRSSRRVVARAHHGFSMSDPAEVVVRPDLEQVLADDKTKEIIEEYEQEARTRALTGAWARIATVLGVATTLFALYYAIAGAEIPFTGFVLVPSFRILGQTITTPQIYTMIFLTAILILTFIW